MIVIVSLSTARDIVARVARLAPGTVARATEITSRPGGKAINVARLLGAAGVECRLIALVDATILHELEGVLPGVVETTFIRSEASLRTDIHIVDDSGSLTVVNAAPRATAREIDAVLGETGDRLASDDVLVVAGRQPPGALGGLLSLAQRHRARLAVDTSGPDLSTAINESVWLVKVNLSELAQAVGGSPADLWNNAGELVPAGQSLVVTNGAHGARAWVTGGPALEVAAPTVTAVNPLGAGDALLAGLLAELVRGADLGVALRVGVACASQLVALGEMDLDLAAARRVGRELNIHPVS